MKSPPDVSNSPEPAEFVRLTWQRSFASSTAAVCRLLCFPDGSEFFDFAWRSIPPPNLGLSPSFRASHRQWMNTIAADIARATRSKVILLNMTPEPAPHLWVASVFNPPTALSTQVSP